MTQEGDLSVQGLTEFDQRQLEVADAEGFGVPFVHDPVREESRRMMIEKSRQQQVELANLEGLEVQALPSEEAGLRRMDEADRVAARAFRIAEAKQPVIWETPDAKVMQPDTPITPTE